MLITIYENILITTPGENLELNYVGKDEYFHNVNFSNESLFN